MKRFRWVLIGVIISVLAIVLLAGCVSKSEYEALQTEFAALTQENASLKGENTSLKTELAGTQSDLTNVQAEHDALQAKHDELNANYEAASKELAEIKEVYPPRDFSSLKELQDWLLANEVSERPAATTAENWYSKALEIQEDALKDGYIVSVDVDPGEKAGEWYVACVTVIDGDLWV